jgi:uncharacterized protein (DUF58 family)
VVSDQRGAVMGAEASASPLQPEESQRVAAAVEQQVSTLIVGQKEAVRGVLISLIAGGHALHIVDSAEALPATAGSVELRDAESGEALALTVNPALRRRYAQVFEARAQAIEAACAAHHLRYVRVVTSTPPVEILSGMFQREQLVQT